jgi:hydroxymethylpyrimidine pyrophosphatase-like HAD family hydrolase
MKTVDEMLIFDVDGVISSITEEKIVYPEILNFLIQKLNNNEIIAFNTGRSSVWLNKEIINSIKESIDDKTKLQNLFATSEKGGIEISFNKKGDEKIYINPNLKISKALYDKVKMLVSRKYARNMQIEKKKTMISIKIKIGTSIKDYNIAQKGLVKDLKKIIKDNRYSDTFSIDPTTIGTDLQFKTIGKGIATQEILNWIDNKGIKPKIIVVFGDSLSDLEMAKKVNDNNLPVKLVYVGDKKQLIRNNYPFPIIFTKGKYDNGTMEFLRTL